MILTGLPSHVMGQPITKAKYSITPFSLLIIKPDEASIADSLKAFADSIERKHIKRYYASISTLEMFRPTGNNEAKKEADLRIEEIKSREMEAYDFKYYQLVSDMALFELKSLLNPVFWGEDYVAHEPILDGYIIDRGELFTADSKKIAKYYEVDYIVTFENIHMEQKEGKAILKIITTLFSAKKHKAVLIKEVEGNPPLENFKFFYQIYSPGSQENNFHESDIRCDNYLECMFRSAIRFATEELYRALITAQKK
jgi:hypothetical protein